MTVRRRLLCALLVFGSLAPVHAEPRRFAADPTSAQFGVGEYRVEWADKLVRVEAFDASAQKHSMATLTLELDTPEGIVMDLEKDDHRLRLTWSNQAARLGVTDMDTGENGARTILLSRTPRIIQEGDVELFHRYDHEVSFAGMVLEQTLTNLGLKEAYGVQRGVKSGTVRGRSAVNPGGTPQTLLPYQQYPPYGADGAITCDGAIVDSGYSVATSRSLCCNAATQATNNACSNRYCWGCCRILGCDAACVGTSDYFCGCSVEGQACSGGN